MCDNYIVEFIINECRYFTVWYTDDTDGFITDSGDLVYFNEIKHLTRYAQTHKIPLNRDVTCFNTEEIIAGVDSEINCTSVLDFWNIISDAANTLDIYFSGDNTVHNDIYAKLVSGCNPDALEHNFYKPDWSEGEVCTLKEIINEGYMILCEIFKPNLPTNEN